MSREEEGKAKRTGASGKQGPDLTVSEEDRPARRSSGGTDESGRTIERDEESDLDSFVQYWRDKGGINFRSEYHKEGAPYVEMPSEWDGHTPRLGRDPDDAMEQGMTEESRARPSSGTEEIAERGEESVERDGPRKGGPRLPTQFSIGDLVDLNTFELISYGAFRSIFGRSLRLPLKREGVIDAEIQVRDKDIIFNTNELYFYFPEFVVWRFVYSHRGKTVLEFGRGVPNGLKIHRLRALRLLFDMWRGNRRSRKTEPKVAGNIEAEEGAGED